MIRIFAFLVAVSVAVSAQETGARYLIITHDNFYNDILPLAQWKHKKGMRTKVVKLSQIGSGSTQIKNYITNAYNTWPIRPEYLLLVGAPNYLPFVTVGGWYSDNYYTNVTGDIYNEILSGRLTVHNTTEAQTVVKKILAYERDPYLDDTLWFKKACLIVNRDYDQDDSIYFSDAYHAASLMLASGFVEIDTLCDQYGHNSSTVINRVNSGRGIVMYRGQGLNNWSYPFDVYPAQTQNGMRLPIVLSITCRTIGTGSSPATAEQWFLTGTPTILRGAAGYFAGTTTGSNIAWRRSAVAKGFHDSLFLGSVKTFGAACEGGRIKAYTMYPYNGGADEYRGYTTIGDPEMNIWTDTPCSLVVNHPATVSIGEASFVVTVTKGSTSSPMNGAIVCIMGDLDTSIYVVDTTDTNGNAFFQIYPQFPGDTLYVTVTGRNLNPYEGSMTTAESAILISYYTSTIDDTIGGNGDNNINPGEEIDLHLWVKNFGTDTALSVSGILRTTDSYITVTDSLRVFGNILPGQICSTGVDGYCFAVAPGAPDGHIINFDLDCYDINDSIWNSQFSELVFAPQLNFYSATISGGNGNNTLEPGETVGLIVTLGNDGRAATGSLNATLRTFSEDVTMVDSNGYFLNIEPGEFGSNDADSFIITADSSIIPGTIVNFTMILDGQYCMDTVPFFLTINTGIESDKNNDLLVAGDPRIYPNPCHGVLNIDYTHVVPFDGNEKIRIYNVSGLLVREYELGQNDRMVSWTGEDGSGRKVPGGVYFVRLDNLVDGKIQKIVYLRPNSN